MYGNVNHPAFILTREKEFFWRKMQPTDGLPDGAWVVDGAVDVASERKRGAEEGDDTVG